jgi:hypothetical protein
VNFVDANDAGPGVGHDAADGFDDVGDVRSGGDWQAEEPGELDGQHPWRRGGRDGDIDDRDAVIEAWVAGFVDGLVGLAELGEGGGLAGPGGPGQDQAPAGGDRMPVEQGQPSAGVDDLPQRGRRDHRQPGVMVQPGVVIAGVVGMGIWWERRIGDEVPPALDRGQVPLPVVDQVPLPCCCLGGLFAAGHHHVLASSRASKMPSGMTLSAGCSSSRSML